MSNEKECKIREDRFTWKAGEVEFNPPGKKEQEQKQEQESKKKD